MSEYVDAAIARKTLAFWQPVSGKLSPTRVTRSRTLSHPRLIVRAVALVCRWCRERRAALAQQPTPEQAREMLRTGRTWCANCASGSAPAASRRTRFGLGSGQRDIPNPPR